MTKLILSIIIPVIVAISGILALFGETVIKGTRRLTRLGWGLLTCIVGLLIATISITVITYVEDQKMLKQSEEQTKTAEARQAELRQSFEKQAETAEVQMTELSKLISITGTAPHGEYIITIRTGKDRKDSGTSDAVRFRLIDKSGKFSHWKRIRQNSEKFARGQKSEFTITVVPPIGELAEIQIEKDQHKGDGGWDISEITVSHQNAANGPKTYISDLPKGIRFEESGKLDPDDSFWLIIDPIPLRPN